MFATFSNNSSLTSIEDLKDWNVENVTEMYHIFGDCDNLKSLKGLENWKLNEEVKETELFNQPHNKR